MALTGKWLSKVMTAPKNIWSDYHKIRQELKPADIILVHGYSRASNIIATITQSEWTHAAIYIGRFSDIPSLSLREKIQISSGYQYDTQMLIESELGEGTIVSKLDKYKDRHIRIVRPEWISDSDIAKVIEYAINQIGREYNIRQIFDLARFLLPWGIFPRRWRSTLFQNNALQPTKDICSTVIARAFQSVGYPILPDIEFSNKDVRFIRRNSRLFTPKDFDLSPYFSVIKYPMFPDNKVGSYIDIHWKPDIISYGNGVYANTFGRSLKSVSPQIQQFLSSSAYAVIGASPDPEKYGNRILRCYLSKDKKVYPVNPKYKNIASLPCLASIDELPDNVHSISVVTPPAATESIIDVAIAKGIRHVWLQPGAESQLAIEKCRRNNINVIANGPCILVELGCN